MDDLLQEALRALAAGDYFQCRDALQRYRGMRDAGWSEPNYGDFREEHLGALLRALWER